MIRAVARQKRVYTNPSKHFKGRIWERKSGRTRVSLAILLLLKFVMPRSSMILNISEKLNKEK